MIHVLYIYCLFMFIPPHSFSHIPLVDFLVLSEWNGIQTNINAGWRTDGLREETDNVMEYDAMRCDAMQRTALTVMIMPPTT